MSAPAGHAIELRRVPIAWLSPALPSPEVTAALARMSEAADIAELETAMSEALATGASRAAVQKAWRYWTARASYR